MKHAETTEVLIYQTANFKRPFSDWRSGLDSQTRAVVDGRIGRVGAGLLGDCKSVGDGVLEMRIHVGPGFRVYFGLIGTTVVLLLCGGNKASQDKDIKLAKKYLNDFKARTK